MAEKPKRQYWGFIHPNIIVNEALANLLGKPELVGMRVSLHTFWKESIPEAERDPEEHYSHWRDCVEWELRLCDDEGTVVGVTTIDPESVH